MNENQIRDKFMKGYDCSQVVIAKYAEKLGLSEEMANKVSACFGGGMMQADTCGAFTGALMVIGLKYGHFEEETLLAQKDIMMTKTAEFKKLFFEKFESCNCRELLGYDVSLPGQFEAALESGRLMGFCPGLVMAVCECLDKIL